jgi:tetratricopeptide (TPR) repeat protein
MACTDQKLRGLLRERRGVRPKFHLDCVRGQAELVKFAAHLGGLVPGQSVRSKRMSSGQPTLYGQSLRRRFRTSAQQISVMAVVAVFSLSCQFMEARSQSADQIQINDLGQGTDFAPVIPDSPSRLSELIIHGQWSQAAELAQDLARREPNDPVISYYLGLTLMHFQDPIGAIRALRTSERFGMDAAYLHQVLGLAYYNVHQFILFQEQMKKATALAPADYKPYYYIGLYLESVSNDFTGALGYFTKARALNPEHTASWYYEGYCLEMSGKLTEARRAYESAIKLREKTQERFSLPYQGMARLRGDEVPAQALEFARKAVEIEPNLDSNHVVVAKICER